MIDNPRIRRLLEQLARDMANERIMSEQEARDALKLDESDWDEQDVSERRQNARIVNR